MLSDILGLPGNRSVFESLQRLLNERQAIAFAGAGASAAMYPMWGQLIDELAEYTVRQQRASPADAERWRRDVTSTPQQRVSTILRKLGPEQYHQFLRHTFAPRATSDGKRFTPIHEALLRLPFRGYVTTNYDPGLEFARMEIRPWSITTATPTWQDEAEVHRWLTGDVFRVPDDCPILWLHGYWQRPATVVLNVGEYAAAYKPSLYRKTFERLWEQDHLVFVGFGFNDPQFTFIVGEILRDIAGASAEPRHIALLGLPPGEDGSGPDPETLEERRARMEDDYHVSPLFYHIRRLPDGRQDHGELLQLLQALADHGEAAFPAAAGAGVPSPAAANGPGSGTLPARWVHETTEDARFTGRGDEVGRLDRWVRDRSVRVIGVRAVGGAGKTALVGHWIKHTQGWRSRPFVGVFAWSFYQQIETGAFLRAFVDWGYQALGIRAPAESVNPLRAALAMLRERPLLLVLDGLEVLQEGSEDTRYGRFLDGELRTFMHRALARGHDSVLVLTSRFLFADLEQYLGTAFHQLELPGLSPAQGAVLLQELGVDGPAAERQEVSRQLEGHPLGLRVFAEALPESQRDHPGQFIQSALQTASLGAESPLLGKLRRLLTFYEEKLPPRQVQVMRVIALFRSPVAESTIQRLVRGLFPHQEGGAGPDAVLRGEIRKLIARGILTREPTGAGHGYAAHPVLRDHFRAGLLNAGGGAARAAANLLMGQPSDQEPQRLRDIEPVLLALELLLDGGEMKAADQLYQERLNRGFVFERIPAIAEGFRCTAAFVNDASRRRRCKAVLGSEDLGFYLYRAGSFAVLNGDAELAESYLRSAARAQRRSRDRPGLSATLQARAELLIMRGRLARALRYAARAVFHAGEAGDEEFLNGHGCCGWAKALSGDPVGAAEHFALTVALEGNREAEIMESGWMTAWGELLLLTGHLDRAVTHTRRDGVYDPSHATAGRHRVLAACAIAAGRLTVARKELRRAYALLRDGQLPYDLGRVHVTAATLALAERKARRAEARATAALALVQPRQLRLVHAAALVVRGHARLLAARDAHEQTHDRAAALDWLARALDDAEDAEHLAEDCACPWPQRDAVQLRAEVHTAFAAVHEPDGNMNAARIARESAAKARAYALTLGSSLKLGLEDIEAAEASAQKHLREAGMVWTWGI